MIRRITVQDYMAHKDTTLELADGVTVITGPNNAGKSALVEAIRSVTQNPPIRHAIRHGAAKAVVRVELSTGEIIEWARTEKNAVYRVARSAGEEPETYAKFGRAVPQDIAALLRMDLVETESGSVDIHIGNQRYPIFLLDQAGSQAAGFFAASTEAEYLLRMQQVLKKRVDRARTVRRELLDKNDRIRKDLEFYSSMDSLGEVLGRAEEMSREISKQEKLFPPMDETLRGGSRILGELGYTLQSLGVLEHAQSPPDLPDVSLLVQLVERVDAFEQNLAVHEARADGLCRLPAPPATVDVRSLEELIQDRASCELRLHALGRQSDALSALADAPGPQSVQELGQLLGTVLDRSIAFAHSVRHDLVLGEMSSPPKLHETDELDGLIHAVNRFGADRHIESQKLCALDVLKEPMAVKDPAALEALALWLTELKESHAKAFRLVGLLTSLGAPPATVGLDDLTATISLLEKDSAALDATDTCLHALSRLPDQVVLRIVPDLEALVQDMADLTNMLSDIARAEEGIGSAVGAARAELQQVIDEMEACPLCGQLLDVEHLLRGGHDGI